MTQEDGELGRFDALSNEVIGACMEVHRHLGPGLLESAYEQCVCHELWLLGLPFERQRPALVAGRWIAHARHNGRKWEIVLEPDADAEVVVAVTAYPVR